jgi:hypothetical protein
MNIGHNYIMGLYRRLAVLIMILNAAGVCAQTGEYAAGLLPTGIKARVDGAEIFLTWNDVPGIKGESYEIRSSAEPFRYNMPGQVRLLGRVSEGTGQFMVTAEDGEFRYYAVTLVHGGSRLLQFHEGLNCLSIPVAAESKIASESSAAVVGDFRVIRLEQGAELQFTTSKPGREIGFFRSVSPFVSPMQFNIMTHVGSLTSNGGRQSWLDTPPGGIPWFHAAADLGLVRSGSSRIREMAGIAAMPVEIAVRDTTPRFRRQTPLPVLRSEGIPDIPTGNHINRHRLLVYLNLPVGRDLPPETPAPFLPAGSPEELRLIKTDLIAEGSGVAAEMKLKSYLRKDDIMPEHRDAARFLLAQSLWLGGNRREAFLWLLEMNPDPRTYDPAGDAGRWIRLLARPYLLP